MLRKPKYWLLLILLAITIAGVFYLLRSAVGSPQRTPDFISFYTAATILRQPSGSQNLYNLALQQNIQRQLAPHGQFLPFFHTPLEAVLFEPFASLSLTQAFMLWSALNLALLAVIFYLLWQTGYRLGTESYLAWIAVWFVPVAEAMAVGQDSIFLALVFLATFLALKKRHDVLAGLALGAGLYRFEIILPFAFIFLLRARRKMLSGFFAACAIWFLGSLAVVGWSGLRDYVAVLFVMGRTSGSGANGVIVRMMPSLRAALVMLLGGKLPAFELFLIVLAGSVFLLGWAAWKFARVALPEDRAFDLQFSLAVIAALLASYHLFTHELTPLIPVAFIVLAYERQARSDGRLSVAKSVSLLLLCFLMFLGVGLTIHGVSLVFFILLGLAIWLSLEITAIEKSATAAKRVAEPASLPEAP
ncbi:MAG: DUF2029 domain-containing protein [Acidobacteriota bacterium]|nr:DUF2029 domain-containing protein [Acidobacteriota bacterium]